MHTSTQRKRSVPPSASKSKSRTETCTGRQETPTQSESASIPNFPTHRQLRYRCSLFSCVHSDSILDTSLVTRLHCRIPGFRIVSLHAPLGYILVSEEADSERWFDWFSDCLKLGTQVVAMACLGKDNVRKTLIISTH